MSYTVNTITDGTNFGNQSLIFAFKFDSVSSTPSFQYPIAYFGDGASGAIGSGTHIDLTYGPSLDGGVSSPAFNFNGYSAEAGGTQTGSFTVNGQINTSNTYIFVISMNPTYPGISVLVYYLIGGTVIPQGGFGPVNSITAITQISFGASPTFLTTFSNFTILKAAWYTGAITSQAINNVLTLLAVPNVASGIIGGNYIPYEFGVSTGYQLVLFSPNGNAQPNPSSTTGIIFTDSSNQSMSFAAYLSPPGIPCFVETCEILTPSGYKAVKDIEGGDLVVTADGRHVPVKRYTTTMVTTKETAPYKIPKNALAAGVPAQELRLSPWHAVQIKKGVWMKPQTASELNPESAIQYSIGEKITYYHLETPNFFKDNLVCNGTVVEAFGGNQLKNFEGRVYKYSKTLKGYTRASGPTSSVHMKTHA
jgi:hypothetical protein